MAFSAILLLFLSLAHLTSQANSFMGPSQNRKFINSGTVAIVVTSGISWKPYAVNVTYPFSFNNPVIGIFLTLKDISTNFNIFFYPFSFYGTVDSYTQTSFLLHVYRPNITSQFITSFGYRYMAFALQDINTFGWIQKTVIQTVNYQAPFSNKYRCFDVNITIPLDSNYNFGFSSANQYAISFLGYDINYNQNFSMGIKLVEGWYRNTTIVNAVVTTCYYVNLYLGIIPFNLLIYNLTFDSAASNYIRSQYFLLNTSNYDNVVYTYYGYSYYNGGLSPYIRPNYYGLIYGPSTLVSLNYTQLNSEFNLKFSLAINDYSINLTSPTSKHTFGFTITKFYTFYCPYATPYLLNNLCYDICPNGTNTTEIQLTCSNTTINGTTNSTTKSIAGFLVGAILGYIDFIFILALLVLVVCMYVKLKRENNAYRQNQSNNQSSVQIVQNNQHDLMESVEIILQEEIGAWIKKSNNVARKEVCSICHQNQVSLITECNHFFHAKCLVQLSNKSSKCPNCINSLEQKNHIIFCRLCKQQRKWVKFTDLLNAGKSKFVSEEFVCPSCLMKPF